MNKFLVPTTVAFIIVCIIVIIVNFLTINNGVINGVFGTGIAIAGAVGAGIVHSKYNENLRNSGGNVSKTFDEKWDAFINSNLDNTDAMNTYKDLKDDPGSFMINFNIRDLLDTNIETGRKVLKIMVNAEWEKNKIVSDRTMKYDYEYIILNILSEEQLKKQFWAFLFDEQFYDNPQLIKQTVDRIKNFKEFYNDGRDRYKAQLTSKIHLKDILEKYYTGSTVSDINVDNINVDNINLDKFKQIEQIIKPEIQRNNIKGSSSGYTKLNKLQLFDLIYTPHSDELVRKSIKHFYDQGNHTIESATDVQYNISYQHIFSPMYKLSDVNDIEFYYTNKLNIDKSITHGQGINLVGKIDFNGNKYVYKEFTSNANSFNTFELVTFIRNVINLNKNVSGVVEFNPTIILSGKGDNISIGYLMNIVDGKPVENIKNISLIDKKLLLDDLETKLDNVENNNYVIIDFHMGNIMWDGKNITLIDLHPSGFKLSGYKYSDQAVYLTTEFLNKKCC
jgi:hypothetical protein